MLEGLKVEKMKEGKGYIDLIEEGEGLIARRKFNTT